MGHGYSLGGFGNIFAVPCAVVDKHIKLSGGLSLKVLLLILRSPDSPPDIPEMARILGMSAGDITDALNYWIECGILTGGSDSAKADEKPAAEVSIEKSEDEKPSARPVIKRQRLPRREMTELISSDNALKGLVGEVESALKKPLTSTDMDAVVALYTYYGLSAHYIMTVVQYCAAIDKLSMHYIERTAANWQEEGVTGDNIDEHVANKLLYRSKESAIRRILGIYDRALAPGEKKYIESWCDKLDLDPKLVEAAYDITVMQIGKLSLAYMNKILISWHQKGISDASAAMKEHETGRPASAESPVRKPSKPKPDNKQFFDADKLERLIDSKLQKDGGSF